MELLNHEKLDNATDTVTRGLQARFPDITFVLKPYYAGMGYCGVEIKIDKRDEATKKEVSQYYIDKFREYFYDHCVTHDEEELEHKPSEVKVLGVQKNKHCSVVSVEIPE